MPEVRTQGVECGPKMVNMSGSSIFVTSGPKNCLCIVANNGALPLGGLVLSD